MKLFIGNCTAQLHAFNYKLPERTQNFVREIKSGEQIMIEGNSDEIAAIIHQHKPYGFVDVKKIPSDFSGLCYSQDKQIELPKIRQAYEARVEFLDQRAQEIRDNSVLSMNNELTQVARNHGKEEKSGFEMTIEGQPLEPSQTEETKTFKQKIKVEK
ncbi:MAG: hypothetical protein ACRDCA_12430 [Serratia sp. (in: enterobacteria)]|uniref:hypothetical protein n=1 Tax=Serratia sp. (in: enterobacteria) TaxID=616 RepID=UPI003F35B682